MNSPSKNEKINRKQTDPISNMQNMQSPVKANTKTHTETKKKSIDDEILLKRQEQAKLFEDFVNNTGITTAFQIIFSELISKEISTDNYFTYVAVRLKEIGKELNDIKEKNKDKKKE